MCGRFTLQISPEMLAEIFGLAAIHDDQEAAVEQYLGGDFVKIVLAAVFMLAASYSSVLAATDFETLIDGKEEVTTDSVSGSRRSIASILKGDVFSYYKLNDTYDTDLKKKNFTKTEEYKGLYDQLEGKKKEYLAKTLYTRLIGKGNYSNQVEIYNYDLKKKGFNIRLKDVYTERSPIGVLGILSNPPKSVNGVRFANIETEQGTREDWRGTVYFQEFLFVPMDEEKGALVENNKKNLDIIMVFNAKVASDYDIIEATCPSKMYL